ncbi:survival of motor neuron-related-splicing factor 30-like [Oppia nitens]|uniref:survival of motor neuron-related-splicing factor 30-like n=1 Tax=Oppia nitens TaxID=1686743 RepID=UPI0023DAE8EA|nr:survival of motor neuron-related-splicing factor 30-like [Oppia nitens]
MSADSAANLRNYQIQLQQVESALQTDPDNNELNKLKDDLLEVIALTKQLMSSEGDSESNSSANNSVTDISHQFEAGDQCLAPLSEDGQFYEARVEDITSDGQCTVVFKHRKISEVCLVSLLKPIGRKRSKLSTNTSSSTSFGDNRQKRHALNDQKEYLKKKQQKKKERLKELEEEREKDKMKWQSFANKAYNKNMKGATKRSIFASPDSVSGRVGVGTCGLGGKPMTEFTHQEKWKKSSGSSGLMPGSVGSAASRLAHNHRYK